MGWGPRLGPVHRGFSQCVLGHALTSKSLAAQLYPLHNSRYVGKAALVLLTAL